MTYTQRFFSLAIVTPTPHFLVFRWPQFTPMHCPFFIGYYFTPTYCVFSVDFFHGWMHPLCSTISAGQGDIPVLSWFYQRPDMSVNNFPQFNTSADHGDILRHHYWFLFIYKQCFLLSIPLAIFHLIYWMTLKYILLYILLYTLIHVHAET